MSLFHLSKKEIKIILFILLAAAALRMPFLDDHFAGDEIDFVGPARHYVLFGDTTAYNACGEKIYNHAHPFVREVVYTAWALLFGFGEVSMRMVPFLFGMATIVFTYLFARKLFGEKAATASAGLMAISRYHIFASHTIATDTGTFILSVLLTFMFFYMYKENNKKLYLAAAFLFFSVSLLTKLSAVIIVAILYLYSLLYYKNDRVKDAALMAAFIILPLLFLFLISQTIGHPEFFDTPTQFAFKNVKVNQTFSELVMDKAFKVATIVWQATPFLAVMVMLGLLNSWRDKKTMLITLWIFVSFIAVFVPQGLDTQRNFLIALPALLIAAGKYAADVKIDYKKMALAVAIPVAYFMTFKVSDFSGYYEPILLAPLFMLPLLYLFLKENDRKIFLVGGMIAMTMFIYVGDNYVSSFYPKAVENISDKAKELGIDYRDVWSSKDIAFYITPENETVYVCEAELTKEFLAGKNVKNLAVYSTINEEFIRTLNCTNDSYFLDINGLKLGTACKLL